MEFIMVMGKKITRILLVVFLSMMSGLYSAYDGYNNSYEYGCGFDPLESLDLPEVNLSLGGVFSLPYDNSLEFFISEYLQEEGRAEGGELFDAPDDFGELEIYSFDDPGLASINLFQENRNPNIAPVIAEKKGPKKRKRTQENGDPRYACKECPFQGGNSSDLMRHARKHTGEKPYACLFQNCDYRTARKWSVKQHEKRHNPENFLACDFKECSYRTTLQKCLEVHKRTHTGEKPYVCTVEGCSYAAIDRGNLARHRKIHTCKKPFLCKFVGCTYRADYDSTVKLHEKHHGIVSYQSCYFPGCNYKTFYKKYLEKHKVKHSGKARVDDVTEPAAKRAQKK